MGKERAAVRAAMSVRWAAYQQQAALLRWAQDAAPLSLSQIQIWSRREIAFFYHGPMSNMFPHHARTAQDFLGFDPGLP
jgi:hypothetical protein